MKCETSHGANGRTKSLERNYVFSAILAFFKETKPASKRFTSSDSSVGWVYAPADALVALQLLVVAVGLAVQRHVCPITAEISIVQIWCIQPLLSW